MRGRSGGSVTVLHDASLADANGHRGGMEQITPL
jgi:hypothetical protein